MSARCWWTSPRTRSAASAWTRWPAGSGGRSCTGSHRSPTETLPSRRPGDGGPFADDEDDEPLSVGTGSPLPELVAGPREGQRETVQAKALLEKADRLMEAVRPEDRPELGRLMEKVRTALTDRRWAALTA